MKKISNIEIHNLTLNFIKLSKNKLSYFWAQHLVKYLIYQNN